MIATALATTVPLFAAGATSAACVAAASNWCNQPFTCPIEHSGPLHALNDTDAQRGPSEWRCYAESTLDPTHQHYVNGTSYCSRPTEIEAILERCSQGMVDTFAVFVHGERAKNSSYSYPCIRIPAITSVPWANGRLLAFAECRHWVGDGCEPKGSKKLQLQSPLEDIRDMCYKISDDSGATWSELSVIQECAMQPTVVAAPPSPGRPNGTIVLQGVTCPAGTSGKIGPGRSVQFESTDAGDTWSPAVDISGQLGKAAGADVGPGTGLRLADDHPVAPGRLLFIGHHGAYVEDYVWYSDDGGRTYSVSNSSLLHMDEALLYVDEDSPGKDVVANMRNDHINDCKCRAEARSTDGGASFGPVAFVPQLVSPVCQATLINAQGGPATDGAYFANPATQSGRVNGTVRRSSDGGHTWDAELPISGEQGGYAYSCLSETFSGRGSSGNAAVSEGLGLLWETTSGDCSGPSCITAFTRIPWSSWDGQ